MNPGENLLPPAGAAAMKRRAASSGWTTSAMASTAGQWRGCWPTLQNRPGAQRDHDSVRSGRSPPPGFRGRARISRDFEFPAYLGYSAGRWDGDTFVVESRGFNDRTPIDGMGHPRSEAMHVTERYHRRDFGHLDTELTFDDPTPVHATRSR